MKGCPSDNIRRKFIMDSESDVQNLPTCCASSVAIVAEGGKVYMVNASGNWVEFGNATVAIAEGASF